MSDTAWPFGDLPRGHYRAIYADPPWHFEVWAEGSARNAGSKYNTMRAEGIAELPVGELAGDDCALFVWITWPKLYDAISVIEGWGFVYKTCAFSWLKANNTQLDLLRDEIDAHVGMGYWTRANSEVCLLATRGTPKRLNADVRQGIIEPRREHSRKPDCVPGRIERLVTGPYLELFARTTRPGWDCWGNETDKFDPVADGIGSHNAALTEIGRRVAAGEEDIPTSGYFAGRTSGAAK
jgi:N6-adenosine-specific RNA methylase IME4